MADAFLTLSDLTTINDANLADRDISDLLDDAPLLASLAADVVPGTDHKYVKETAAPVVGFRAVGDGLENTASSDTLVTINLKILDASFAIDKALADAYLGGPEAYIGREAARHLKSAFFHAEKQILSGTGNEADGYNGLPDDGNLNAIADDMVISAGGTTASTGSSCWAIRSSGDMNDAVVITGDGGKIDIGESVVQRLSGSSTGSYPAYYTPISAWMGLQVGGKYSVGRLTNVTADSGATMSDSHLAELLGVFPAGRGPSYLVMSRRSLKQLQQSRTATNATGAPAPFPSEAFGVPIIVSDGVSDVETLVS